MKATLDAVHPVLGSTDLRRSIRFFESLGSTVTFQDAPTEPRHAAVVCDGVELHLRDPDGNGLHFYTELA